MGTICFCIYYAGKKIHLCIIFEQKCSVCTIQFFKENLGVSSRSTHTPLYPQKSIKSIHHIPCAVTWRCKWSQSFITAHSIPTFNMIRIHGSPIFFLEYHDEWRTSLFSTSAHNSAAIVVKIDVCQFVMILSTWLRLTSHLTSFLNDVMNDHFTIVHFIPRLGCFSHGHLWIQLDF